MEKRLEKLKLDENLSEEGQEDETVKIEQQCVSLLLINKSANKLIFYTFRKVIQQN